MREEEPEFVDFSLAFEEDEEETDIDGYDEEYEEERRAPALFRGLSFLRRRKDFDEESLTIENEEDEEIKEVEEKEDVQPAKEEVKEEILPEKKKKKKNKKNKKEENLEKEEAENSESQDVVDFEDSVNDAEEDKNEEIVEEQKAEKKKKGFSLFAKKEKEIEIPAEEETETVAEEQPVQEEMTGEVIEIPEEAKEPTDEIIIVLDDSEETTEDVAEEIVLIDDFEEKAEEQIEEKAEEQVIEENEKDNEEQESEKKFARFAFLNKRQRVISSPKEEPVEEKTEKTAEEPEVELLLSFEEAEAVREEPTQVETVAEETAEAETVDEIEEIPPFEATVTKTTTETVVEQEEIKENLPFEVTLEETVTEAVTEQEEFKEIPPFEETVAENIVESVVEITEEPTLKKKKKEKKEKKIKESTAEQAEKTSVEPMTMKDHLTFILIILALLLTIAFIVLKFIPLGNNDRQNTENSVTTSESVSEIEIQRKDASGYLIQTDIDNVFYAYSPDYGLTYYQCDDRGMKTIQQTEKVNAIVDIRSEKVSVKVDYVEVDGKLFGTGVFRKTDSQGNYLHDTIVFKLVNLPKGYEEDGKALLLATTNSEAISRSCNVWDDSFVVDLEIGETTRFISSGNSMYSLDYSILTDEGYASANGKIPFFTTREYDATTNKKDIYLKVNDKESRLATDVAGSFVYVNGDTVSYLKSTEKDFNVIRNDNGKEQLIFSLDNNTSYLYYNEYLLDKYNGILYNVKTGEKITVTGYGMSNPEMMAVSSNGKYLVVLGTVNSAIDYQVHIFDLEKNEYAKYVDDNFSKHENLAFVDETTIVYSVVEPRQGYEYVMLDTSKAFR